MANGTTGGCGGVVQLDPIQALVDYINDIKPYHTKVIEILTEYVYEESVDVTILEQLEWTADFTYPAELPVLTACDNGYSTLPYGGPKWWPIVSPNQDGNNSTYPDGFNAASNSFTVPGDRSGDLTAGTVIELLTSVEDYANVYPIFEITSGEAGTGYFLVQDTGSPSFAAVHPPGSVIEAFQTVKDDNRSFTVVSVTPLGSPSLGVTRVDVAQAVLSTSGSGFLGLVRLVGTNNSQVFGSPDVYYTIVSSVFSAGTIDQWPGYPDPNPPAFLLGDDPHTIITVAENIDPPAVAGSPDIPLTTDQVFAAFVRKPTAPYKDLGYGDPVGLSLGCPQSPGVAAAIIAESLEFGWGGTYRWNISSVNVGGSPYVSEVLVAGDVTNVLYVVPGFVSAQISSIDSATNTIRVIGDVAASFPPSVQLRVTGTSSNNGTYEVVSSEYFGYVGSPPVFVNYTDIVIGVGSPSLVTNEIPASGYVLSAADANDVVSVVGSVGSVNNDGQYEVAYVSFDGTYSTIGLVNPVLPTSTPAGGHGVLVIENIDVTNWFQYSIREALPERGSPPTPVTVFEVYGNALHDLQANQQFRVYGTTNDGLYTVSSSPTYNAGTNTTDIPVASITFNEKGGWIESARDTGMHLVFEDSVRANVVEDTIGTLVLTAGSMLDAWDYNYWDVGSWDEDLSTVIYLYSGTF